MGDWSYTTGIISPYTTSTYTYTGYTIPLEVASNIPDSTYGTMYATLYQYSSAYGGTPTATSYAEPFTVELPDDVLPTIQSCSMSIDNSNNPVIDSWGVAIVGFTKFHIAASATGAYGSEVISYTVSGDYRATIYEPELDYTTPEVSSSGNKAFVVTCTDSRGRVSKQVVTNTINVLPYTAPKATKLSVSKKTFDDEDASNDRLVATAVWTYDLIDGHNSTTCKLYYKEINATDWIPHSGSLSNGVPFLINELVLDERLSYNIQIIVTDSVGKSSDKHAFSSTRIVLLDFKAGGDGLGIGKVCSNEPGLEVSMDATFYNEIYLDKNSRKISLEEYILSLMPTKTEIANMMYPIGSFYITENDEKPWITLSLGTEESWIQIKDIFLLGAGDYYSAGETGGEYTHTLTIEEMPSHTHYGVRRNSSTGDGTHSTGASAGDSSTQPYTDAEGSDYPHNNMPPYVAVYIWKRVG